MLITYFKDTLTLARYRSGLANLYLENFIVWFEIESQGYRRFTIRRHVRVVMHSRIGAEASRWSNLFAAAADCVCNQLTQPPFASPNIGVFG
jgi:hypothetical protein